MYLSNELRMEIIVKTPSEDQTKDGKENGQNEKGERMNGWGGGGVG